MCVGVCVCVCLCLFTPSHLSKPFCHGVGAFVLWLTFLPFQVEVEVVALVEEVTRYLKVIV